MEGLLHFDVSKCETEEDLIEIRFKNEDILQFNFSKLFNQSKYFRDKYKYSEAFKSFPNEIEKIKNEFNMNDESIKLFIEIVEKEKVDIPFERYKDIYTLSEYFCIPKFIRELDTLREKELYKNFDFTLQILIESERTNNNLEMQMMIKIENFLSNKINDCLENSKFGELPIPTICRIVEKSKEKVDFDLLFEFIFKSAETRFILIKFVSLDKLSEDKLDEMIKFIEEQDESSREIYLSYIPFNLSLIKLLRNKYEEIFEENRETKEKINQEKKLHEQTKKELKQEKISHEQMKKELYKEIEIYKNTINKEKEEKKEQNTKFENQIKKYEEEVKKNKELFEELKDLKNKQEQELTRTKEDLDKCQREIKKYCTLSILVGGRDDDNQLGEKPNNKSKMFSNQIISPPLKLSFDPFSLLSYSIYGRHSVVITDNGLLKGIGNNKDGQITSSLEKTTIDHFTDFYMKDGSDRQLDPVSAVCYAYGTLYMFSKMSDKGRQLVLCDKDINGGDPVFLDIGNHQPVALFGGDSHSATICSEGEVIFIDRNSVKNSPESRITSVSLPYGEKASSVACCNDSIVVLSSNGRVFSSPVEEKSSVLKFSEVDELSDKEIVCVSGTCTHVFAVSKEGCVFGRGSNKYGKLGLGEEIGKSSSFTEISSLRGYKIRAAYAGYFHSHFETHEGKILSCGWNNNNELLLNSGPCYEKVYSPTETIIASGATFCIAGYFHSVVFIGNSLPPNMPNTRIQYE